MAEMTRERAVEALIRAADVRLGVACAGDNPEDVRLKAAQQARSILRACNDRAYAGWLNAYGYSILSVWEPNDEWDIELRDAVLFLAMDVPPVAAPLVEEGHIHKWEVHIDADEVLKGMSCPECGQVLRF